MAKTSFSLSEILVLAFILAIAEMARVNGELCERASQTYSRLVCHNLRCDRKCISWEKATHGACHLRNWMLGCYCYFEGDCSKFPPPPPASGGGGSNGGSGSGSGSSGGGTGGDNPCKQYVNSLLAKKMKAKKVTHP